jgi:hypothetical protein
LPKVARLWGLKDDTLAEFGPRFARLADLRAGV